MGGKCIIDVFYTHTHTHTIKNRSDVEDENFHVFKYAPEVYSLDD